MAAQGHRLTSYLTPGASITGVGEAAAGQSESAVIVDRCDVEHNTTQRWRLAPADGGTLSTARVVTVVSVDGRCLTGKLGAGGITVVRHSSLVVPIVTLPRPARSQPRNVADFPGACADAVRGRLAAPAVVAQPQCAHHDSTDQQRLRHRARGHRDLGLPHVQLQGQGQVVVGAAMTMGGSGPPV